MKLKKLFAGILAVAMMATMAAPAFAADMTSANKVITTIPNSDVTITKVYTENNGRFDTDSIKFELVKFSDENYVHVEKSTLTDADVQDLKPTFALSEVSKDVNGALMNSELKVHVPNYAKVGVYTYQVKEVGGNTLGMTYDTNTYTLRIAVANKMLDGKATDDKVCYVTLRDAEDSKVGEIINTYNAGNLSITKKVEGNLGDRSADNKFKFKATFNVPTGYDLNSTLTVPTGSAITWNSDNTVGTVEFKLAHNETFTISNLPYNMTYTVEELNADDRPVAEGNLNGTYTVNYDTKVSGEMNAENLGNDTAIATTVTNTYGDTTIDTGVILDNAPYIALMMVVVAGAAVMIIKKRRHFED